MLLWYAIIIPIKVNSKITEGVRLIKSNQEQNIRIAEDNFLYVQRKKPKMVESYLKYSDAYIYINRLEAARKKLQELKILAPDSIQLYMHLGKYYEALKEDQSAITEGYSQVLRLNPDNILALDMIAKIQVRNGNFEIAKENYNRILKKEPNNVIAHYGLLNVYIKLNDLDNVRREHYKVLTVGSKMKDPAALVDLAKFYIDYEPPPPSPDKEKFFSKESLKNDLLNMAEDTLKRVLKMDKDSSEGYYQSARLAIIRNDALFAEAALKKAIELKNDARFYNTLGKLYYDTGNTGDAIRELKKAQELDPNMPDSFFNLANINFYALDNYFEAEADYLKSEDLGFRDNKLIYNLGWISYRNGNYQEALARFGILSLSDPANPTLAFVIGNCYLKLHQFEQAKEEYTKVIEHYQAVLARYPRKNKESPLFRNTYDQLTIVYNNIGVSHEYLNESKKALQYYWKAIESAKAINYFKENAPARVNMQYALGRSGAPKSPVMLDDIPKDFWTFER